MADALSTVIEELTSHPSNAWARDLGCRPVWAGSPSARIAIIGQAPGRRAQESSIPGNDARHPRILAGMADLYRWHANNPWFTSESYPSWLARRRSCWDEDERSRLAATRIGM